MKTYLVIALVGNEWTFVGFFDAESADAAIRAGALEVDDSQLFRACPMDHVHERQIAYRRRVVGLTDPATPDAEPMV